MNEPLHPAQFAAIEKLKRLRVGALYMERQEGKLRTVLELVRHRLEKGRIEGVLWLCTRRRLERIEAGVLRHAPELLPQIRLTGIESLSHNLDKFMALMRLTGERRLMLVIDNGLLIKNGRTLRTQRVFALSERCPYRLLISDVPFTRQVSDMFSQWYALDWRILGYRSYWGFSINHLDGRNAKNTEYLTRRIQPYCAQILRRDVQPTGGRREYVWQFELPKWVMAEYRSVAERFLWKAMYSTTGVYRMLQACQHTACGRRVVQDYPMCTEPLYERPGDDPRMRALMDVLAYFESCRVLVLCRYRHECEAVYCALCERYGAAQVGSYPEQGGESAGLRFTVMNVYADEREKLRILADVIIYYSSDWDWQKRQEKEQRCQSALPGGALTVVSLAAADTIDRRILECVWNKENLVDRMRRELNLTMAGN